jgi:nicotinate-nucleotide adenylyltransferase
LRVGLYGGTFDPIHNAHLIVAQFIREELELDKIIFIPAGVPPHKEVFSSKELRMQMVQSSIEDNPVFECSDVEIRRCGTSYSVDTIAQLKEKLGASHQELFWIIGSDNFLQFPGWKDPQKILAMCRVVVFPRYGYDFDKAPLEFKNHTSTLLIDAPLLEISSTQIRTLVQQNRSIKYLVPPAVESVIKMHNLYR